MDKCCVCSKQPRISGRLLCESTTRVRAASAPLTHGLHTHCKRSTCEPGEKGHLTYSSRNQAWAVFKLLCNNCRIVKTKIQCMNKHLDVINYIFLKNFQKMPPSTPQTKKIPSHKSPNGAFPLQFSNALEWAGLFTCRYSLLL